VRDKYQIIAPAKVESATEFTGPVVVVGFDERPSSPDIVTGVVLGLRRMGCVVVDLAQTSLPVVAFGVHFNNAAAGLFVTGAGCDPSVTGFEIMTRDGRPFPNEGLLQLEQSAKQGVGRQTRQIGAHKPHQILSDYIENLQPYFHALRPLRIVCGSSTRQMPRVLDRLFARLPCTLTHVVLPTRKRDLFDGSDIDLQRVANVVVEEQHHLGIVFDEDGRRAAFVTDIGRLASPREVARMVIEIALHQQRSGNFVVSTSWLKDVEQWLAGRNAKVINGAESVIDLVQSLAEQQGCLALSADGRIWFRHSYPACDALIVFAYLLQALSLSDAPFSDVIARVSVDMAEK
jgi:phosphomannomutase